MRKPLLVCASNSPVNAAISARSAPPPRSRAGLHPTQPSDCRGELPTPIVAKPCVPRGHKADKEELRNVDLLTLDQQPDEPASTSILSRRSRGRAAYHRRMRWWRDKHHDRRSGSDRSRRQPSERSHDASQRRQWRQHCQSNDEHLRQLYRFTQQHSASSADRWQRACRPGRQHGGPRKLGHHGARHGNHRAR